MYAPGQKIGNQNKLMSFEARKPMALKLDSNNRLWLPIPEEGVPYITNLSSVNFNILNTGEWRLEKLIEILSLLWIEQNIEAENI